MKLFTDLSSLSSPKNSNFIALHSIIKINICLFLKFDHPTLDNEAKLSHRPKFEASIARANLGNKTPLTVAVRSDSP
jgi:hypothetical protein